MSLSDAGHLLSCIKPDTTTPGKLRRDAHFVTKPDMCPAVQLYFYWFVNSRTGWTSHPWGGESSLGKWRTNGEKSPVKSPLWTELSSCISTFLNLNFGNTGPSSETFSKLGFLCCDESSHPRTCLGFRSGLTRPEMAQYQKWKNSIRVAFLVRSFPTKIRKQANDAT